MTLDAVIAMPIYRDISVLTHVCMMNAYKTGPYEVIHQWNDAILSRARAILVWRFLTDGMFDEVDTFVFIDSDMVFGQEALDELVFQSKRTGAIVGAACSTRGGEKMPLSLRKGQALELGPNTKPQAVRTIGTPFTAIPRTILEKMTDLVELIEKNTDFPFWPMFEPIIRKGEFFAEDTSFCFRAREVGANILAMTNHQVGHIGEHTFVPNQGRYEQP